MSTSMKKNGSDKSRGSLLFTKRSSESLAPGREPFTVQLHPTFLVSGLTAPHPAPPHPFPTPCTSHSGQIRLLAILWMCHISSHLRDFANVVSWLKHPLFPPPQEPAQTPLLYGPFLGLPPSDQINCHILQAPTTSYILFYYNLPRCISLRYFPPFYSRSMCLSPCTVKCGGNTWVRCTPGSPEGYLSNWRGSYPSVSQESARNLGYNKETEFYFRKAVSYLELCSRCIIHPWGKRKAKGKHKSYIQRPR